MRVRQGLEDHCRQDRFLRGARPGTSDSAGNGQLTQLVQFDPTPMALAVKHAPRVCAWVALLEDLSGIEVSDDGWFAADAWPSTLRTLLGEIGRLYVPVLLANAQALHADQPQVQAVVDGQPWVQQAFPYQGKCLAWLRRDHQALGAGARPQVDRALAGPGRQTLSVTP